MAGRLYGGTMTRAERRERREQMAEKIRSGMDAVAVAKLFGVTTSTVYAACRGGSLGRNLRRQRNEQIVEQILAGKTTQEVEKELGVGPWTIIKVCNAAGVKVIRKQLLPLSVFRFVALLLNTTLSQSEMARELGVSPQMVSQYVQRAREVGIKFAKRGRAANKE